MERDPTLVWQLVLPAINYISDIARLSQTCQSLHAICAREMRFSTALFETIDQDLMNLKDKGPIGWAQTDNGTTWFSYLSHVQIAITAANETHKLHASASIPFLKLCRYTLFTHTLLRHEHRVISQMMSVMIRLPSNVPELSGGLLFMDCHTNGGYSTHVTCYIPRSKMAGTPTDDLAYGADVPFDPCQRALQTLFRSCPLLYNNFTTDKQMVVNVFTTGNGVERQFASVFESLIANYNDNRSFTMTDLLSNLFKGINFGHTYTVSIPPKSWRPLFYPSVSFLYEHPLSKLAFLNRFDLAERLEQRVKSLMKIPIFLALFDSAFSWDPEESDCNSEMSEDYEFLTDDEEDNLLEEVSDFMPLERLQTDFAMLAGQGSMRDREGHELRQAMISIRSGIPEATWDPVRELNEGIVDEGYHQFHMTSLEPAYEETSEQDAMDLDLSSPDANPVFQFTPELALSMFKNMTSKSTRGSSYFSADVIFKSKDQKWHFKLMLEDPILYDRFTNTKPKLNIELQSPAKASEITSTNVVDSVVLLELFEAFGLSVDALEPAKLITQLKQFLVLCAKTVWLSEYNDFIYAIDKRGSSFEKSVGHRELLLREDIGFDGYECFEANFINVDRDKMFDQMEELVNGVQIEWPPQSQSWSMKSTEYEYPEKAEWN